MERKKETNTEKDSPAHVISVIVFIILFIVNFSFLSSFPFLFYFYFDAFETHAITRQAHFSPIYSRGQVPHCRNLKICDSHPAVCLLSVTNAVEFLDTCVLRASSAPISQKWVGALIYSFIFPPFVSIPVYR
jgi:hypothetical protein